MTLMLAGTLLVIPAAAWACPVCFGDPNSPMVHGMNWAILLLLGITGGVLTGFAAFIVYLFRRSRMMLGEGAPEARPVQSGGGY
jgi:hypothetical protein